MILTATPYRVSLFGGGTDYPEWFTQVGSGATLGMAINHYCRIAVKPLSPIYDFRYRIVYSKMEDCQQASDIQHPAVRGVLKHLAIEEPLEIAHMGDLPARSGLGASSAFMVGLLNALHRLRSMHGLLPSPYELAEEATHVERDVIGEVVGCQDQTFAAHGGLLFTFFSPRGHEVQDVSITARRKAELESSLFLAYTGQQRSASEMATKQLARTEANSAALTTIGNLAVEARDVLLDEHRPLDYIGEMLHTSWQIKRQLFEGMTSSNIDEIYERGRHSGAIGGKLLGAGGGGFLLFYVQRNSQAGFAERLGSPCVRFRVSPYGSRVLIDERNAQEFPT